MIKRKLFVLLASLIMTSYIVGTTLKINETGIILRPTVVKELQPYVDHFKNTFHRVCSNKVLTNTYNFKFEKDPIIPDSNGVVGYCQPAVTGFQIVVSNRFWVFADEDERFHLMMHEQSHCFIGKDHVEDPDNYMYPTLRNMNREQVQKQLEKDMEEYCNAR